MNYRQALHLLSQRGNEVTGIHLGLQRIAAMMQELGNPHHNFATLHIAGTNGKGSVAAMSEAILRAAGWRTGLYTSPHLEKMEERIRVAGRNISARKFATVATSVLAAEDALWQRNALDRRLTYFEFVTACAFHHFASEKIDIGVIEVGLGGRLDATNVVKPRACIITGIAMDHQNLLGPTLADIAGEKAGIIKPGIPVIAGARPLEVRRVIRAQAAAAGAPLREIDNDFRIRVVGECGAYLMIDLQTPLRTYRRLRLGLAGAHQARNAALAIAGIEALDSFPVKVSDVRHGIRHVRWPGRLEEYQVFRRTLFEGAHNEEGARALRNHLTRSEDCEIHLVFGVLADKEIQKITAQLFPLARSIHLTPVANPRTASPAAVAAAHSRYRTRLRVHRSARAALEAAWSECPRHGLVVITGSLYLVGELLPLVRSLAE